MSVSRLRDDATDRRDVSVRKALTAWGDAREPPGTALVQRCDAGPLMHFQFCCSHRRQTVDHVLANVATFENLLYLPKNSSFASAEWLVRSLWTILQWEL